MFFHQLGNDFVLALELFPQRSDGPKVFVVRRSVLAFECGSSVLEELLLPDVEQRGCELVLVAEVGDRDAVDEVAPKNGDLLDRRIVLAWLSHRGNSC